MKTYFRIFKSHVFLCTRILKLLSICKLDILDNETFLFLYPPLRHSEDERIQILGSDTHPQFKAPKIPKTVYIIFEHSEPCKSANTPILFPPRSLKIKLS